MGLLDRLIEPDAPEDKIPIHQFMAAIAEFQRGAPGVTVQAIVTAFSLSSQEQNQLVTWYQNEVQTGNLNRELIHDALLLGEGGQYTKTQVMNRLNLT